jgi:hypothetical protein
MGDSSVSQSGDGGTFASLGSIGEDQAGAVEAYIAADYDDASFPTTGFGSTWFTEGTGQWTYRAGWTYKTNDVVDIVRFFPSLGTITGKIVSIGMPPYSP